MSSQWSWLRTHLAVYAGILLGVKYQWCLLPVPRLNNGVTTTKSTTCTFTWPRRLLAPAAPFLAVPAVTAVADAAAAAAEGITNIRERRGINVHVMAC